MNHRVEIQLQKEQQPRREKKKASFLGQRGRRAAIEVGGRSPNQGSQVCWRRMQAEKPEKPRQRQGVKKLELELKKNL